MPNFLLNFRPDNFPIKNHPILNAVIQVAVYCLILMLI